MSSSPAPLSSAEWYAEQKVIAPWLQALPTVYRVATPNKGKGVPKPHKTPKGDT